MRRITKIETIDGKVFYCSFKNEDEMYAHLHEIILKGPDDVQNEI